MSGGATFPRLHVWSDDEDVAASDLNAEFNNILNNLNPAGLDGYEDSAAQMKLQTNPGTLGTESLATSLAGELERLRYVIARAIGNTSNLWYDTPPVTLTGLNTIVAGQGGVPRNRVQSGRTRSATDGFPIFLQVDGTLPKVTLKGASTPFVYYVDGTQYTISSDVSISGMALAPSVGNSATISSAGLSNDLYGGERDYRTPTLGLASVGSSITPLAGSVVAFRHGTEYLIASLNNAATSISQVWRGVGFDSTDTPVSRQGLSDGDTLALMNLHWIYATTSGIIVSSTNTPTISATTPTSPHNGDYWFDLVNQTWKTYNGAAFVAANATLIGWVITDSAGAKASRCVEFYAAWSRLSTVRPVRQDNTSVITLDARNRISVAGNLYTWPAGYVTWDTGVNRAPGVSLASGTSYYLYITERGQAYIDTEKPYDRTGDLLGFYHPYHLWRFVAPMLTDGSSNVTDIVPSPVASSVGLGGVAYSANIASFDTSNTSFQLAGTVNLVTSGRPVEISLQPNGAGVAYLFSNSSTNGGQFIFRIDGVEVFQAQLKPTSSVVQLEIPPTLFMTATPSAGKHSFQIGVKSNDGTADVGLVNCSLSVREIGGDLYGG